MDTWNVNEMMKVYFIAGTQDTGAEALPSIVEAACRGGITCFQFREKGAGSLQTDKEKVEMALILKRICHHHNVPFFINDDVELALASEADGLHIGQEDEAASIVRSKIGPMLLGVSAYTLSEAGRAASDGADYIGVGPMFQTSSKADAKEAVGPERIRMMRQEGIHLPITAIGGITKAHLPSIQQAGADGVSIISAISRADSPEAEARALLHTWDQLTM
ncbi:thiamine phosphate synthase [Alkalicoccus urumqiensis]|uniref:Thiamine-phosphate synthase n=1 Tax=Alkalicoccus urumqiensis TaxID=1548213 RepID=A0A2P6MIP9_ALKUR|nr:thiamine phosphate synthase [Alkalicoccus urumqiensis]PRO66141.1 thiamine phosphate synthase [Alkalicoccus urumqiensis]